MFEGRRKLLRQYGKARQKRLKLLSEACVFLLFSARFLSGCNNFSAFPAE